MIRKDSCTLIDTWIDWEPAVFDYALIAARARCSEVVHLPRRGKWRPADWDETVAWMAANADQLENCETAASSNAFFLKAQACLQDTRSCAQRRADRNPPHIRSLFQQIASCGNESERRSLRHYAGTLMRAHRAAKDEERARSSNLGELSKKQRSFIASSA